MKKTFFALGIVVCVGIYLFSADWPKKEVRLNEYAYTNQAEIAASGRNVYVCWTQKAEYDSEYNRLFFQRSSDNGRSWLNRPIRIDCRGAAKGVVERPKLAASGAYVYAIWRDTRSGKSDIYLNYSANNGLSWLGKDIRIDVGDKPGASHAYVAEIAAVGARVYVAWHDMRNGKADIYVNVSSNYGKTWLASPLRLDGDAVGAADSRYVRVSAVNNKAYVVWQDDRNGKYDIYINFTTNGGTTWLKKPVRLDRGSASGAADSYNPKLVAYQTACFVVWEDYRRSNADIYLNYTRNNGASWQARDIRLDRGDPAGLNDSLNPEPAMSGDTVYVVWEDYRNELNEGPFIYLNKSNDRGNTWLASDIPVETLGTSAAQAYPQVAANGGRCCVLWRYIVADQYGYDHACIGLNYTKDEGATWRAEEFRMNPENNWGTTIGAPHLAFSGDYVHAVWLQGYSYSPVFYNGGNILQILDSQTRK